MQAMFKFAALLVLVALIGCKSTEEKLAEKMVACDGDTCNEIIKEIVQLPLEKQITVKQLMMLDTTYQKKIQKQEIEQKTEIVFYNAESYIKLQAAVFVETGKTGDFKWIGFHADSNDGFFIMEGKDNAFEAVSYIELGECPAQTIWTVKPEISNKNLNFNCSIISDNEDACAKISENFLALCK